MKQLITVAFSLFILIQFSYAQPVTADCTGFSATYTTKESRCASTGSITITPSGGSGNYSYKVLAPVSLPITSTSTITGLAPGTYTVQVKDMESGCTIVKDNLVVGGSYSDPRFQLQKTDLTCIGSSDGSIAAFDLQNGRNPFTY
ncbi:MAG: SprB repeat-containing protein, partial [Chitinophagaceae bacterium]|nr:SprB repeat-containing protein [Chitinophagaceae bacterium]